MPAFSLRVRERIGSIRVTTPDLWCPRLDPGRRMDFDTTIAFHDRGLHRLDGVEATTTFPFGLFEKKSENFRPDELSTMLGKNSPPNLSF